MKLVRLKHLCEKSGQYGLNITSDEYTSEGLRFIRTSDITDNGVLTSPEDAVFLPPHLARGYELHDGDILFSRSGTVGRSFVYERAIHGPCAYAGYLIRFRPKPDVDSRFLYYYSKSRSFLDQILLGSTEATISNFNADKYGSLEVPSHAAAHQGAIADFLDRETIRIDELIDRRGTLVERLRERFQANVARLLEPSNDTPRVRLSRFLLAITDGPFGSRLTSDHYALEGARVIRLGNIGLAEFNDSDKAYIPMTYFTELRGHEARSGDLVIAGLGDGAQPLGRACVVPDGLGPAIVKADCFRVRLDQSRLLHSYVAWFLSSAPGTQQTETYTRGATRARINTTVARELMIPMPSISAQRKVVERCEAARTRTKAMNERLLAQIDLLHERRQALITAAITGQLDVAA